MKVYVLVTEDTNEEAVTTIDGVYKSEQRAAEDKEKLKGTCLSWVEEYDLIE